jgi:putative transposase
MLRSFKYRLYPTYDQRINLSKNIGACRWVYNWALETKTKAWMAEKKRLSQFDLCKLLVDEKKNQEWLCEANSQSLLGAIANLDKAYNAFFRKVSKFPKFKSRHRAKQSFTVFQGVKIDHDKGTISLIKHGKIEIASDPRRWTGQIKSATVRRDPDGRWYVSVLVDDGVKLPKTQPVTDRIVGVDLGLISLATVSTGEKIANPKFLNKSIKKIRRAQRVVSRRKRGSKRRDRARYRLACVHSHVGNQRNDFLHKLSHKLVAENQGLAFEDLAVSNMVKNHRLARSIQDAGWSTLVKYCKYKSVWSGKPFIQIGRFEPSSKLCSCGVINRSLSLSDRTWTCQSCGSTHDRDILAAQNIKRMALHPQVSLRADSPKSTLAESL